MLLILPIGQENQTVRRLPLVTLVISAINVIAFILTFVIFDSTSDQIANDSVRRAFDLLQEHPHLELHPDLVAELNPEFMESVEIELAELRSKTRRPAQDELDDFQALLDQLCLKALDALQQNYVSKFGFTPAEPKLFQLFTAMFMHGGWMHLLGNMFIFYISAPFLEDVYGRPLFTAFYLTGGVAATLAHVAMFPESTVPLVGASGAIAAVMGGFLVRFFSRKIRFVYFFWYIRIFYGTFHAPAYLVLPLWLMVQLSDAAATGGASGVAYWAHIGGFAFGFAVALGVKFARLEARFIQPSLDAEVPLGRHPDLDRGIDARLAGKPRAARALLLRALPTHMQDHEIHLELYRTYLALREPKLAAKHASKHLSLLVRSNRAEDSIVSYEEIDRDLDDWKPPATAILAIGRYYQRTRDARRAVITYERLARLYPTDPSTAKGLGYAADLDLARSEPKAALETLRRALTIPRLDRDLAQELTERAYDIAAETGLPMPAIPRAAPPGTAPPLQTDKLRPARSKPVPPISARPPTEG